MELKLQHLMDVKDTVTDVKDTVMDTEDTMIHVTNAAVDIADTVTEDNNQLLQNIDTSGNQGKESTYLNSPLCVQVITEDTQRSENSTPTIYWFHNFRRLKNKISNKHLFRPHPSLFNYFQISRNHQHQEPLDTNSEVNNQNNISID
ncbi:hypothetical protein PSTG_16258 [Puccinia striiformis f. sp. tritici PST-78]|uniref:Uncharacterized protein n=1 Tax=Puccinia striiformis f. sp. tritici PST-78 TaxID=1165861 RepID=A0A0L0UTC8_9BASI|nr:hypothetical protein PSTG_16258 [Puccinia striiformis f. sp. tritici PST-78]